MLVWKILKWVQSSSSKWSSSRAISTDIPDAFSPPLLNVHRFRQVLRATHRILTELLYEGSSWSGERVDRNTSLMSSSLLFKQFPACLVRRIWIVFVMGGSWPYSFRFVGFCLLDLFNIARSILVHLLSSIFSNHLVRVYVVHPFYQSGLTSIWPRAYWYLACRCLSQSMRHCFLGRWTCLLVSERKINDNDINNNVEENEKEE